MKAIKAQNSIYFIIILSIMLFGTITSSAQENHQSIKKPSVLIFGHIIDSYGLPVPNAIVTYTDESNTNIAFKCTTAAEGYYEVSLSIVSSIEENSKNYLDKFKLHQNYPNPFNPSTVIPFFLIKSGFVNLSIYNILGQKVKTLVNDNYQPGMHQVKWDGTNNFGVGVAAGIYIYRITAGSNAETKKMVLLDGGSIRSTSVSSSYNNVITGINNLSKEGTQTYRVNITGNNINSFEQTGVVIIEGTPLDFIVERLSSILFAVQGDYLGVYDGSSYSPLFIKGVNLGVSVPGTQPGELAATAEQYQSWLAKMGEIGINSIRIYTLHFPRFYQVLADYNSTHTDKPLYLFQGIWLDEENPYNNLEDLAQQFDKDIEEVIDCVHGNRVIEQRRGKAYGEYTVDISKWIIGYIIGREISPDEVLTTDKLNPDNISYNGVAVQLQNGTPSEVWAVERLDKTITYERNTYDAERPVSLSSWPTLDPLTHPTEDSTRSQEDAASIDLENLDTGDAPAGYFVSFHAYPYYPDFISEDPDYITYSDNTGPNSYLGYLTYLKKHYSKHPLIVAEYGVPSSWGNAHFAQSGMDQGGLDEKQQGEYNVRMLENIYNSGCGGGILFSWIDEWFKQCWINNPIGPEASRRPLWHNVTNPEQNYGLIAFDTGLPDYSKWEAVENSGRISQIRAAVDNKYFYVQINLDSSLALGESLVIGYDTYRNDMGESILPEGAVTSNRAEFALRIVAPDTAQLYVTQAYDLFGIWHNVSEQNQLYHSIPTVGKPWVPVRWKNNYYEDAIFNAGQLRIRNDIDESTSLDAVTLSTNKVEIRIPWTYLNFTDPSLLQVMDDNRETEVRETAVSDGIAVTVSIEGIVIETNRFKWAQWDVVPQTTEREKTSLNIFADGIKLIPEIPPLISLPRNNIFSIKSIY